MHMDTVQISIPLNEGIDRLVRDIPNIYKRVKSQADDPDSYFPKGRFPCKKLMDLRSLRKLDCINIIDQNSEEDRNVPALTQYIDEFCANPEVIPVRDYLPFLREGVILHHFFYENVEENHHKVYLHFNVLEEDPETDYIKVQLCVYEKRIQDVGFLFRQATTFEKSGGKIRGLTSYSTDDLLFIAYHMPMPVLTREQAAVTARLLKEYNADSPENIRNAQEINGHMLNVFAGTFMYLNKLISERSIQAAPGTSALSPGSEDQPFKVVRKSRKNKRRKIVFIGGPVIECAENSGIKIQRGKIVRHVQAWTVRGHYRHYRSGKVVYIKPYEKGPEKGNILPEAKEYRAAMS